MIKKIIVASMMVAAISNAQAAPYVGAGLGIITNTTTDYPYTTGKRPANYRGAPLNIYAGYSGMISDTFYLAGEAFSTLVTGDITDDHEVKTTYGYGASILPGMMLTNHSLAYVRAGLVRSHFTSVDKNRTGGQLGLGLQMAAAQNVDVRGEYTFTAYNSITKAPSKITSPRSDAVNIALIYKFE